MTGLLNLIADHSSKLNILPILVVMNVIIAILIHLLTKKKITKYLPSLALGIVAIFILITSFKDFTTNRGLNLAWMAVFMGSTALVGVFTCFILDLAHSIRNNTIVMDQDSNPQARKHKSKNKASSSKKVGEIREVKKKREASKKRVAKKPHRNLDNKDKVSKYNTSKIYLKSDDKKVRATKISSDNSSDDIIFESYDSDK